MLGKKLLSLRDILNSIDMRKVLFITIIISLNVLYYLNPFANTSLTAWDRTFCLATLYGNDINIRIHNMYFFLGATSIILTAIFIVLSYLFAKRKTYLKSFVSFALFCAIPIVISWLSRYDSGYDKLNLNKFMLFCLLWWITLFIVAIVDCGEKLDLQFHIFVFLLFALFQFIGEIFIRVGMLSASIGAAILIIAMACVWSTNIVPERIKYYIQDVLSLMFFLPVIARIGLEIIYWLTYKGHIISRYYTYICVLMIISCLLILLICLFWKNISKKIAYYGAIISYSIIAFGDNQYQFIYSNSASDLFELGNKTVAIDSIVSGKVPILDYFSAHALSDVWTRIVYALVYSDNDGILVDPWNGLSMIVAILLVYYIAKEIIGDDYAILWVLLFPLNVSGVKMISGCLIGVVASIWLLKRPTINRNFIYWICLLVGAFYIYDEGISLGIGTIIAILFAKCIENDYKFIKQYLMSGGITGVGFILVVICYFKQTNINFGARINEWIELGIKSNSSWATENFGDPTTVAFELAYFIIPIFVVIMLLIAVCKVLIDKKINCINFLLFVFLCAELLYIPRTYVWHNLEVCSGSTGVLLNYFHWSVTLFVLSILCDNTSLHSMKITVWVCTMIVIMFFEGTAITKQIPSSDSILICRTIEKESEWDLRNNIRENNGKKRVIYSDETKSMVEGFREVLDVLLEEDQTFIDFANLTALYYLTNRVRPCYVGQSPSLLTTETSQKYYINEIEEYDCPLAVIGTVNQSYFQSMAGVPHNIRYYKIAEYIYSNFRPLVKWDEFAIWCKKDVYDDYYEALSGIVNSNNGYEYIDYGYDGTKLNTSGEDDEKYCFEPPHWFYMELVPYVWGNFDKKFASNNNVINEAFEEKKGIFVIDGLEEIEKNKGNYISFICDGKNIDKNVSANIVLSNSKDERYTYSYGFKVVPGINKYIIRVSQDYFWYATNIDKVEIECSRDVCFSNVCVLEGD